MYIDLFSLETLFLIKPAIKLSLQGVLSNIFKNLVFRLIIEFRKKQINPREKIIKGFRERVTNFISEILHRCSLDGIFDYKLTFISIIRVLY